MEAPGRHTNVRYEQELAELRAALLKMGCLVDEQISRAIDSLVRRDSAKARETIARDADVNRLDIEIDERSIRLIALYQPEAGDLRLITTGLKITTDLERIGDNAVNICERVLELEQQPELALPADIRQMVVIAQSMVRDSIEAFTRGDTVIAEQVIARDDEVDRINRLIHREVLTGMAETPRIAPAATQILFISKYLERIADHATNVAEMVVFMVKGLTLRHMDANRRRSARDG